MTSSEGAGYFVELAKVNQDQIWRRRQSEWKTSFMMWALFVAVPAYLCKEVDGPLSPWLLGGAAIGYVLITLAHLWHLLACLIADEIDMRWMHYYKAQAELKLGREVPEKWHTQPAEYKSRLRYLVEQTKRRKYFSPLANILVTVSIVATGLALIASKLA